MQSLHQNFWVKIEGCMKDGMLESVACPGFSLFKEEHTSNLHSHKP